MPKKIKMLKDFRVAKGGVDVETWAAGSVHEDVPDALADDLMHQQTLAAVEVTGDAKADAAAEEAAKVAAEKRAAEEAAALAALNDQGANAGKGAQAPKPPKA